MLLLQGRISPPSPPPKYDFMCNRPFRFERNSGKMYSRLLFPYGGLENLFFQPLLYLAPLHVSPVDRDGQVSEISPYL